MERIRSWIAPRWSRLLVVAALAGTGSAPAVALAQFGPTTVTLQVVDQNGQVLNGSVVQLLGTSTQWVTPATVTLDGGPQVLTVFPAFQGAMFPGGFALPTATNGLSRSDFVMVDGSSPTLSLVWQTAQVAVSVVDQGGVAIPGAQWGFDGEGGFFAPGTITAPLTDPNVNPFETGPSASGWRFAVQAAFAGQAVDLVREDTRAVDATSSAFAFEWRQTSCNMGVVDGTGAGLRGATWTMLGHTFAEGDAITLPVTDATLYPSLTGALAAGIPTSLSTNTASGTGSGTFAVMADGSLAPPFVDVNGSPFGLRCGVSAPPPPTTGTLAGTVTKDGSPFAGAAIAVVDAASVSHNVSTDGAGAYSLTDVPQGTATVTLTIPSGTHGVDPSSGTRIVSIVAEQTTTANFSIATNDTTSPPPIANNPESWNYWWHEAKSAQKNHATGNETLADMRVNFPLAIFNRFANAATDPIRVEGVTLVDPDGAGPQPARPLSIDDMVETLDPSHANTTDDAKAELLVVLLNVVSGRLSLPLVVDARGTTLAQEIHSMASMINDHNKANDAVAAAHGHAINSGNAGRRLAVGLERHDDGSLDGGASSSLSAVTPVPTVAALHVSRQPDASLAFAMSLPAAGMVSLDVYDVMGRHVAQLWQGTMSAGTTQVTWARGSARPGMYFARMMTPTGAQTAKALVAQ
jgi:hypothetical protein